jgi:N-acyl-D-aspartate/D-glutamate deacylase
MRLALQQIQEARDHGQRVTADQYPYIASSTSLDATLLPSWAREGGRQELQKRLENPETAAKIRSEVARTLENSSRIQLASCRHQPRWIGRSLTEIADAMQTETVDVVLEIERNGGAAVVNFAMSDGGAKISDGSQPHPRSFGTFPRKIGYYAVDQQLLSLSDAVRSATGLPAEILGLTDRGLLAVGKIADVCVFDAASFRDRATFDQPWLPPSGMRYVLVNGQFAVYDGQATGALAGRAIRKQ